MKYIVKCILIKVIYIVLIFFRVFKIKRNQIFFDSYDGRQYSDSPKYIYEAMSNIKYKKIWFIRDYPLKDDGNTIIIRKKGFKYFYYILTSKVVITNMNFSSYIPFKKKQILINTWHGGGAYKYSIYNEEKKRTKKSFKKFTYFLSSSEISTRYVIRDTFGFENEVINSGLPRNDIFYEKNEEIRKKINEYFNIDKNLLLVLYAPTYRDFESVYVERIDFKALKKSIELRFNQKCLILNRAHHFGKNEDQSNEVVNATYYPDMQELLTASNILITDYSSSIWDFTITKKPCFLFTPDLDEYINKRSFYIDIDKWGVPFSKTNNELFHSILAFEYPSYVNSINKIHKTWGSYETGNATQRVIELIERITDGNGRKTK